MVQGIQSLSGFLGFYTDLVLILRTFNRIFGRIEFKKWFCRIFNFLLHSVAPCYTEFHSVIHGLCETLFKPCETLCPHFCSGHREVRSEE